MKAQLLRTSEQQSRYGGRFYYFFFKGEDGKSYRSCMYPNMGNFKRWKPYVGKTDVWLDNLVLKGNLIDADSHPRLMKLEECPAPPVPAPIEVQQTFF